MDQQVAKKRTLLSPTALTAGRRCCCPCPLPRQSVRPPSACTPLWLANTREITYVCSLGASPVRPPGGGTPLLLPPSVTVCSAAVRCPISGDAFGLRSDAAKRLSGPPIAVSFSSIHHPLLQFSRNLSSSDNITRDPKFLAYNRYTSRR